MATEKGARYFSLALKNLTEQMTLEMGASKREKFDMFQMLVTIFDSAHAQLKAGRRGDFAGAVRRAAEDDLLGVADALLAEQLRVPAAVLAGRTGARHFSLKGFEPSR